MEERRLKLQLLDPEFGIIRFDAYDKIPDWIFKLEFYSITRTETELTIVCPSYKIPEPVDFDGGWKCLRVEGTFSFNEIGIIASLSNTLAQHGISIYVVSTYDTDYVSVKEKNINKTIEALQGQGHQVFG